MKILERISELQNISNKKIRDLKRINLMPATHYLSEISLDLVVKQIKEDLEVRLKELAEK